MEGLGMDAQLQKIAKVWPGIQNIFSVPHNSREYNNLRRILDSIIDEVGEDESHKRDGQVIHAGFQLGIDGRTSFFKNLHHAFVGGQHIGGES